MGIRHNVAVSASPTELEDLALGEGLQLSSAWVTIVWNDPINLMSYVTFVFQQYFGYPKAKAEGSPQRWSFSRLLWHA